jgi:AmpE protein
MTLLSVVIAYLILRWWGTAKPLQWDTWYHRWCEWLAKQPALVPLPLSVLVFSILGPVVLLLLVLILARTAGYWLQLFIAVPVLLYAVGRGKYSGTVMRYLRARQQRNWVEAVICYEALVMPGEKPDSIEQDNWAGLDQRMLTAMSYRGFERIFAVLFWFILLGPAGALLYRLSALYLENNTEPGYLLRQRYARRWLWLLEWPAARVLGLSFALTGNFAGCIHSWRNYLWSAEHSTAQVLVHYVLGALRLDDEALPVSSADIAEREFKATLSLFSRTLIFWLCVLAVLSVVF